MRLHATASVTNSPSRQAYACSGCYLIRRCVSTEVQGHQLKQTLKSSPAADLVRQRHGTSFFSWSNMRGLPEGFRDAAWNCLENAKRALLPGVRAALWE